MDKEKEELLDLYEDFFHHIRNCELSVFIERKVIFSSSLEFDTHETLMFRGFLAVCGDNKRDFIDYFLQEKLFDVTQERISATLKRAIMNNHADLFIDLTQRPDFIPTANLNGHEYTTLFEDIFIYAATNHSNFFSTIVDWVEQEYKNLCEGGIIPQDYDTFFAACQYTVFLYSWDRQQISTAKYLVERYELTGTEELFTKYFSQQEISSEAWELHISPILKTNEEKLLLDSKTPKHNEPPSLYNNINKKFKL